jgi:hypothetical protein
VNSEPSKGAIIVIVSKALCFAIFAVFCLWTRNTVNF